MLVADSMHPRFSTPQALQPMRQCLLPDDGRLQQRHLWQRAHQKQRSGDGIMPHSWEPSAVRGVALNSSGNQHLDTTMSRISLVTMLEEHAAFTRGLQTLVRSGAYVEANYVLAIMQTDLAEIGQVPPDCVWLQPGEVSPAGWDVYKAALDWCHDSLTGGRG
jgi:hypothetical protein